MLSKILRQMLADGASAEQLLLRLEEEEACQREKSRKRKQKQRVCHSDGHRDKDRIVDVVTVTEKSSNINNHVTVTSNVTGTEKCHSDMSQGQKKSNEINGHVTGTAAIYTFPFIEDSKKEERKKVISKEGYREDGWPNDYRDRFWKAYPKRVQKKAALKALDKARTEGADWTLLIERAAKVSASDPQYIPYPASWLNKGGWMDEQTKESRPSWWT